MQTKKNAFTTHTVPSPFSPNPNARKLVEILSSKNRRFAHPYTWDGSWTVEGKLEGYRSLGMFNIKKAIRT